MDETIAVTIDKIVERVQPLAVVGQTAGVAVTHVAFDHRSVTPGSMFCCLVGAQADGHDFASLAYRRGAVAFICEHSLGKEVGSTAQLVVGPGMARQAMALAACALYDDPAQKMRMVGVTGTNGKTTTTQLLRDIFEVEHWSTGVVGTLGGVRTTPESPRLQRLLSEIHNKGAVACAMEVTSHALAQHRVDGIRFDVAVFTNLSQDHLDFHHSMESYFAAKAELFTPDRARFAVICRDDEFGRRLLGKSQIPAVSYSLEDAHDLE
ncbi:MAG: Mur ligase family protein, partial [Acidimicrobiales bacterium]